MPDLTPEKLAELRRLLDDMRRFLDGWERGHEAKYWVQTGLTPYGLTLDPERAPGVLNWLGVNYYTPDSPHLPKPAAVVLPTVGEVREAIIAGTKLGGWMPHTAAQAVLDLIASRVPVWQPVEPGTVIKAGTVTRIEWDDRGAREEVTRSDYTFCQTDLTRFYLDPRTVPAEPVEPVDPRAELLAEKLHKLVADFQANGNSRELGDPTAGAWFEAAQQVLDALNRADR